MEWSNLVLVQLQVCLSLENEELSLEIKESSLNIPLFLIQIDKHVGDSTIWEKNYTVMDELHKVY